jgi:hypothetical protein
MIFVVEVPHAGEPQAWFAFNGEDLLSKTAVNDALQSWEVYDTTTARELLSMVGAVAETQQARSTFPGICRLGDEFGLDTTLYRADYLLERGCYQPDAVSVEAASEAALKARVSSDASAGPLADVRIYWHEEEAVLATENDPFLTTGQGWKALHALREQLLALDVLAEN